MKIGVIGIGGIAKKAYLPVYAHLQDIEFHFYTRNKQTLLDIQQQYRFTYMHHSLDDLINNGITAAFVHSATDSHYELIKTLLLHDIHVYVDKPITYHLQQTKELTELAKARNLQLFTGFNRRFAPTYQACKEIKQPNLLVMQKNRYKQAEDIRTFVYDDFIHVIDTLLFLFTEPIEELNVSGKKEGEVLYHAVVQFHSKNMTAIAIMNRDSGTREERLEVMSQEEKRVVRDVATMSIRHVKQETKLSVDDWAATLEKRGFEQIVQHFIDVITKSATPAISMEESLKTHEICEQIIDELLK
ncbi:Gfo/Idh/MocA family protein [Heyndrickxia ginsengihumi]|uniref:Gfo/Idh/MocA family protein n=1 Tax=Heyndrickxia ginsengihumi TaxID=363870 RepID=UPI001DD8BD99|nr:Gfo/Idh/MocA family oxidoreductase [Heyndrickxia ginsengihumi]MBE6184193.1 Gfo/Idh/MocA family oxidoreductase [Bacillus sp. (in: firmicutes)]MCM3023434.1 Gfo/Idh/MocA family oxidoreductase [Heyndrickxia ginsengihumi]